MCYPGAICLGDVVQILHASGGRLARQMNSKASQPLCMNTQLADQADFASTTSHADPVKRNTFKLERCPEKFLSVQDPVYEDEKVHYGQKILISAADCGTYLTTSLTSAIDHNGKHAFFSPDLGYRSVWQLLPLDPVEAFEAQGI